MVKKLLYLFSFLLILSSCKNQEASIPAYITVNGFEVETDFGTEGTSSSNITTIWVEANGEEIGAFELPVRFPLIADGSTELTIIPGINLNGSQAYRNTYDFYNPFVKTYNFTPGNEFTINSPNKSTPVTGYKSSTTIDLVEDFEGAGINLEKTAQSDTLLYTTKDSTEIFIPPNGEANEKSGKIVMPKGNSLVEFKTIQSFNLPQFGSNVYLEVNYKCDVSVTFGVFAKEPGQSIQAPVVTVYPTSEWKKIYINLVTEVSGHPNANSFEIFFGAINTDPTSTKNIFIDNLKLVY